MFLLDKNFLIRTDNAAFRNLLRRDLLPTTRVQRWIRRLSEYTFKIEYQRDRDKIIADILFRLPFTSAQSTERSIPSSSQLTSSSSLEPNTLGANSTDQLPEVAFLIRSTGSSKVCGHSAGSEREQSDTTSDFDLLDSDFELPNDDDT